MIAKGVQAELWAARFLQRQGLRLLAQNYRCRVGEIDLIMQDGVTLVFIEVRMRSNPAHAWRLRLASGSALRPRG